MSIAEKMIHFFHQMLQYFGKLDTWCEKNIICDLLMQKCAFEYKSSTEFYIIAMKQLLNSIPTRQCQATIMKFYFITMLLSKIAN